MESGPEFRSWDAIGKKSLLMNDANVRGGGGGGSRDSSRAECVFPHLRFPRMRRLQRCTEQLQALKTRLLRRNMEGQRHTGSGGLPLARKLCYAVGGVPYQITNVAMGVSLQIFLLDVVQLEASYVSVVLLVSRAWDAVTDPLVGYLVGRSRWTPIGKLIPWLALSTPFGVLFYLLMWFIPPASTSHEIGMVWFLAITCLFETLMSCYNVPYLSLSMFLGGDRRDRDSATAHRMSVEMVAMLLASAIQGRVVAVYNAEKQHACQQLYQDPPQGLSPPPTNTASLQETQKAFLTSGLVIAALFFVCSLVLFLGVKEEQSPVSSTERVQPSFLTSVRLLIGHVPYQRLVLGFVFSALAFQMSLGNFALFCSHAAGLGAHFQHLLLVLLVSASVAVPLWQVVLLRIGKRATVFIGLSLFIPAVIVVACVPSNLPVFMTMCILMGCSVATIFLLPWSMLPDVVDNFVEQHPSCKDLEPLFFSCYAFCNKLAGGLSVGLSTLTLQFVGYRADACHHDDRVVMALTVLFAPVPIVFLLIGMVWFRFYPVDERQRLQLQETLTPYRHEAISSSPSDQRGNSEQPHTGVTTTSHSHTSNSSLCSYDHYEKGLKSSVTSNESKSLSVSYSRSRPSSSSSSHPRGHSKSHSSPRSYTCATKNLVKSPVAYGSRSRSRSAVVQSEQDRTEQRAHRHPADASTGGRFPGDHPAASSHRSQWRSKVSWV